MVLVESKVYIPAAPPERGERVRVGTVRGPAVDAEYWVRHRRAPLGAPENLWTVDTSGEYGRTHANFAAALQDAVERTSARFVRVAFAEAIIATDTSATGREDDDGPG